MKNMLIILTDFNGLKDEMWLENYQHLLQKDFNCIVYDTQKLGEIACKGQSETQIHQAFVDFGIQKAVDNLLKIHTEEYTILGFSVGGTIAWKAALYNQRISSLYAVSATRLRFETLKPAVIVNLSFGELDMHRPNPTWSHELRVRSTIFENANHEVYKNSDFCSLLCAQIIRQKSAGNF